MSDDIESMIEGCELNSDQMNDWELEFIDDISRRFYDGYDLTDRQIEKLRQIHSRVTRL